MNTPDPVAELLEAITGGDANRVRDLLANAPTLADARNEQGVSAVMIALYHRQPGLADLLLEAGAVPDAHALAALGRTEDLLAQLDADPALLSAPSPDGFTLLHLACFFDRPDTARALIERGADVNAVAGNPSRVTALHSAAACSSTPLVTLLLEHGADPDAQQHGGYTALMSAALHGNLEMAEILLAHNATSTLAADDRRTARAMAAEAGHDALVKRIDQ